MGTPVHLIESDYSKNFPPNLDEFPTVIDREHYIDAWQFNTIFNSIQAVEQYLIDYQANIEAPLGDDIIGDDGQYEIPIPAARYPAYKTALAWDSELLEENIKEGVTIFGVEGTLSGGGTRLYSMLTGGTASAIREQGGYEANKACDGLYATAWDDYPAAANDWWIYDLGAGNEKIAAAYSIKLHQWSYPTAWKLQGDQGDNSWVDIDTQSAQAFVSNELKFFWNFSNTTAYRRYRLLFTGLSGNDLGIREITIYYIA